MEEERIVPQDRYRRHYQETYAQSGYSYERYEDAYEYGRSLGQAYEEPADVDWMQARPEARRGWMARSETPWPEVEEAVREGWRQALERA